MIKEKGQGVRALVLITTERSAQIASDIYREAGFGVQYSVLAEGTASSDILDMLGLGATEKRLFVTLLKQRTANGMLRKLHNELSLSRAGGGIGFTLPITGLSNMLHKVVTDHGQTEELETERRNEEDTMNNSHTLIAAILNRGFANDVMTVAKEAGARGGTIVNSRQIVDEDNSGFWGISMQEEKEILLIITEVEKKLDIMKAVTEQYGINSEARGVVVSMPVDTVMGV